MSQTSTLTATTTTDQEKYITFHLNGYRFALPSKYVLKIMVTPASKQGGIVGMGFVQVSQYSIQILNLQTLLKLEQQEDKHITRKTPHTADNFAPTFLIILQLQQAKEDLWGMIVDQPPDLQNISVNQLKLVPNSKRVADALNGISHIVTGTHKHSEPEENDDALSQEDRQISLILDVPKLIKLSKE